MIASSCFVFGIRHLFFLSVDFIIFRVLLTLRLYFLFSLSFVSYNLSALLGIIIAKFLFLSHYIFIKFADAIRKKQPSETLFKRLFFSYSILLSAYAIAAPKSFRAAVASSSGASLQITLSHASVIPAPLASSSQFLIHSPSPHP